MLWPTLLPFQITACIMLVVIVLSTLAAPLLKWRRVPTFFGVALLSMLAFVPACDVIMKALDARRFGVFDYDTFGEVRDFRVERYLPPAAKQITIDKYPQGFRARFTISQTELDQYMDYVWRLYGDRSVLKRGEMSAMASVDEKSHEHRYGDLGWLFLDDATEVYGPTAANGAGFSIWYSRSRQMAYQRAGYW